jgi:fucose 4-O-acetylase-like acetyltransferase
MIFFYFNGKAGAKQKLLHGFMRLVRPFFNWAILLCIFLLTACKKQNTSEPLKEVQLVNSNIMSPFMEVLGSYDGLAQQTIF